MKQINFKYKQNKFRQQYLLNSFTFDQRVSMSYYPSKNQLKTPSSSQPKKPQKQSIQKQQLKSIILKNQNPNQKGYYTIQQWKHLHSLLFTLNENHITSTIINCWRMLKLVNFGDDFLPTGIVYDIVMTLINVDETVQQTEYLLKSILFKFIEINGKSLTKQQKEQLAFFKVIKSIVEGYRKIITDNLDLQSNFNYQQPIKDRNEQLYRLYNVMIYKKNLQKLKKIQTEFKQCTFEPQINQYSAEIGQSRYKSKKKKIKVKNDNEFPSIDQSDEYDESKVKFKANPVPNYPQYTPVGHQDHLQRMQRSRQIQRINSLRISSHRTPPSVQQFSIQQRSQQRRRRKLQNCRILFMIKVEVGKRLYRVKVRQQMHVKQTVQAIQKMVGFKNPELEQVVKGYFYNWQRREQSKQLSRPKINSQNSDCISIVE